MLCVYHNLVHMLCVTNCSYNIFDRSSFILQTQILAAICNIYVLYNFTISIHPIQSMYYILFQKCKLNRNINEGYLFENEDFFHSLRLKSSGIGVVLWMQFSAFFFFCSFNNIWLRLLVVIWKKEKKIVNNNYFRLKSAVCANEMIKKNEKMYKCILVDFLWRINSRCNNLIIMCIGNK